MSKDYGALRAAAALMFLRAVARVYETAMIKPPKLGLPISNCYDRSTTMYHE